MYKNKTIYVHIGFPKTATTTLQNNVFCGHSDINYFGKPFHSETKDMQLVNMQVEVVRKLWRQPENKYERNRLKYLVKDSFVPFLDSVKKNIISLEEFSYATERRLLIAERLRDIFKECKIIITIRSQQEAIISAYFWKQMNLEINEPFDDWFQKMVSKLPDTDLFLLNYTTIRLFNYAEVIEAYERVFKKENILVLPMEWLKNCPEKFSERLSSFIGINCEETSELLSMHQQNTRMSMATIKYQRFIKRLLVAFASHILKNKKLSRTDSYQGVFRRGPNGMISDILNICSNNPTHHWTEKQLYQLNDYYVYGNSLINKRYDLNLDKYGYLLY